MRCGDLEPVAGVLWRTLVLSLLMLVLLGPGLPWNSCYGSLAESVAAPSAQHHSQHSPSAAGTPYPSTADTRGQSAVGKAARSPDQNLPVEGKNRGADHNRGTDAVARQDSPGENSPARAGVDPQRLSKPLIVI